MANFYELLLNKKIQSLFSSSDLLAAVGLSLESAALRYMLVAAAGLTYATYGIIGRRGRDIRVVAATFLGAKYVGLCLDPKICFFFNIIHLHT